jgi:superfamily I DNA and/or RNA helicase
MSRKAILRMSVINEASTEQSTKLMRYQSVSRVVDENEEEWNVNIRKAQREFDRCWRTTCQYYIDKHTLVVFVTAVTSIIKLLKDFRPFTIVIDEASQMAETAIVSVVATFFQSVQKLVLAGDLMQNSSFVESDNRNEFASTTERSLMERMMITGVPSIFLCTQYRMHLDISDTLSRHFYQGRLVDAPNVSGRIEEGIFRMFLQRNLASCTRHNVFVHIAERRMYVSKKGGSKVNPPYVAAAQQLVSALIAAGASGDAIGLRTFYKAQLQIHPVLSPPLVNVITVDACQGREFDDVVVDTVSPSRQDFSLGFLTNPKKIHVALSRAKHGLIVVGSQEMGKGPRPNRGAKIWDTIIQDHLRQGSFSTMTVDSRRIEEQFFIPGEHYASARRDRHG